MSLQHERDQSSARDRTAYTVEDRFLGDIQLSVVDGKVMLEKGAHDAEE